MFIKTFSVSLLVFLGIDMIWLTVIAKNFYSKQLGFLMAKEPNLLAAITFYLIFVAGLTFFVISPALQEKSWTYALFAGAFFGLVTYATYDLTNLATIKDWPIVVTVIDLVWGTLLSASVSVITYFLINKS